MTKVYHGSCLCRAIQYTITGEPFTFYVCHCVNCRKSSGSAFLSNGFFKKEQVKVTKGSDHIRVYHDMDTKSGAPLLRSFCPTCSASLFIGNNKNTLTIVSLGTLDDEVDWVPRGESFTHSRRNDFASEVPGNTSNAFSAK
ncbi:hypothetical protein E4T56_gene18075 [Termitomyces sp. T112]|nr:hypothetical protein E4T56_gene18075 [Termitomyces sp. T112]